MFELDQARAKLLSVNPRSELHGERHVPAADLGLQIDLPNHILSEFGPQLRASLFQKAPPKGAAAPAQGELDAVVPLTDMPHLKNPAIDGTIKLRFEGVGYRCKVGFGLGGPNDLVLEAVKVNGVKVLPREGGSVQMSLRVQATEPSESVLGRLCSLIGAEVDVTLIAPEVEQEAVA